MVWKSTGIRADELAAQPLKGFEMDGETLVLVRVGGSIGAFQGTCPHEGGPLPDGTLSDGRLVCPLHGATFDGRSGAVLADPDGIEPPEGAIGPLPRYPTRVVDGVVEIDLADASRAG